MLTKCIFPITLNKDQLAGLLSLTTQLSRFKCLVKNLHHAFYRKHKVYDLRMTIDLLANK